MGRRSTHWPPSWQVLVDPVANTHLADPILPNFVTDRNLLLTLRAETENCFSSMFISGEFRPARAGGKHCFQILLPRLASLRTLRRRRAVQDAVTREMESGQF